MPRTVLLMLLLSLTGMLTAATITVDRVSAVTFDASVPTYFEDSDVEYFKQSDIVYIAVVFDGLLTPTAGSLALDLGTTSPFGVDFLTSLQSGGETFVIFQYVVERGHNSPDLNYMGTGSLSLTATPDDGTSLISTLLPIADGPDSLAGTSDVVIDTNRPTISSVSSLTANGTYGIGQTISIAVNFSEPVRVVTPVAPNDSLPTLTLETGNADATATYASGSGTNRLVFTYTVAAGENTSALNWSFNTALALNDSDIYDLAGNAATITLPGSLGGTVRIDTTGPQVTGVASTNIDGTYGIGDEIIIEVVFDEAVTVSGGPPSLDLEVGTNDAEATYFDGSGTTTLRLRYTVAAGDASTDLEYVDRSALQLNGGTITDQVGNQFTPTDALPGSGSSGSLAANSTIIIDTDNSSAPATDSALIDSELSSHVINDDTWTATCTFSVETGSTIGSASVDDLLSTDPSVVSASASLSGTTVTLTLSVGDLSADAGDHLLIEVALVETQADTTEITHTLPVMLYVSPGGAG